MDTMLKVALIVLLPACGPAVVAVPFGAASYYILAALFALAGFVTSRKEVAVMARQIEAAIEAENETWQKMVAEEIGELPANWRAMFYNGEGWTGKLILEPVENGIWSDMWELTHDIGMEVATSIWEEKQKREMETRLAVVSEGWYRIEKELAEEKAFEAEWETSFQSRVEVRFNQLLGEQLKAAEKRGEEWGPFGADHLRWVAMSATCPIRRKAALSAIHGGASPLEFASVRGYTLA